jgi:hypothetical protein
MTAHPPPIIRGESFNTLGCLGHVFIITTSNGGLTALRLTGFMKPISTKHSTIMEEAVQMSSTESNVVGLGSGTGDTVQIKGIAFVGYQRRRNIVWTLVAGSLESGITAATFGSWICRGRQSEVPLSNFPVFWASQEEMRAGLGDDSLGTVGMAAIDTSIGVGLIKPAGIWKEIIETSASRAGIDFWGRSWATAVFEIENSNLGVSSTGNHSPVIGVGHEFDGEDIGMMTSVHARVERERFGYVCRVVLPYVEVGIIGARGEQSTGSRPTMTG